MDNPTPNNRVRKSFINFVLKEYYKWSKDEPDSEQKKFGQKALRAVLTQSQDQREDKFKRFLLYELPRLILISKRISNKNDYFEELIKLHRIDYFKVKGYFKGIYKNKEQTYEHNSLCIIGRKLAQKNNNEEINSTSYVGKKYFESLIERLKLPQVIAQILELPQYLDRHKLYAIDSLIKRYERSKYDSLIIVGKQLAQQYQQQQATIDYSFFKSLKNKTIEQIISDIQNLRQDNDENTFQKHKDQAIEILQQILG